MQIVVGGNKVNLCTEQSTVGHRTDREHAPGDQAEFLCECADAGCRERIPLDPDVYAVLRARWGRFIVVPGHRSPEFERVVADAGAYLVVEKCALAA